MTATHKSTRFIWAPAKSVHTSAYRLICSFDDATILFSPCEHKMTRSDLLWWVAFDANIVGLA